ncbi:hypothetical protein HDU88_008820 [Geranomyces variabilis]|nr:hypothetical protein HDU88_008820 [Geranomyces variabilis]
MTTWAQRASAPKKPAAASQQQAQPGQSAAAAAPTGKAANGRNANKAPTPPKGDKAARAPSPTKSSKSISPVRPQPPAAAPTATSSQNSSSNNIRSPSPAVTSPKSASAHHNATANATPAISSAKTAPAASAGAGASIPPTSDSRPSSPTKLSFAAAAAKSAAAAAKVSSAAAAASGKGVNGVSADEAPSKAGKEQYNAGKPPVAAANGQQAKGNTGREKPSRQNSTPGAGNEAPVVQFKGAYKKMQQTNQANLTKKPSFGSFDAEASKSVGEKPAAKESVPAAHQPPPVTAARTPSQASVTRAAPAPTMVKPQQKSSAPAPVTSAHEQPIPAHTAPASFAPVSHAEHTAPGPASAMVSAPLPNQIPPVTASTGAHPSHSASMHHPGHQMHPHAQPPHHTGYPQHQQAAHYGMVHPGYPQQQGYRGPPQQMARPPMAPQNRPFRQPLPHSMPMGMSQSGAPPQAMAAAVPGGGPQMFYPDPNMFVYYQHQAEAFQHHQYMQQQQFMNYNQPRYMMPQHGPPPPNARYPSNAPTQQPPSTPKANKPRVAINLKTPDGKAIVLPHQTPAVTHPHVHPSTAPRTADVPAPVKIEPSKSRVAVVLTNPNTGIKQVMGAHDDGTPKSPVEESKPQAAVVPAAEEKPAVKTVEKEAAVAAPAPAKPVQAESKPAQAAPVVETKAVEHKAPEAKPVPAKAVPALKTEIKDVQTLVKPKSAEVAAEKAKIPEKAPETKPAEVKKIVPVKATDKENVIPVPAAAAPVAPKPVEPKAEIKKPVAAPAAPKEQAKTPETKEVKAVTKEDKPTSKEDASAAPVKEEVKAPTPANKEVKEVPEVKEVKEQKEAVKAVADAKEVKPAAAPKQDAKPNEPKKVEKADKPVEPELEEGEIREPAAETKPVPESSAKPASAAAPTEPAAKPTAAPAKIDTTRPSVMTRLQSFEGINYPSSIASPTHEPGQPFQYQRDFLMQFANIIKDKPEGMASLEQIFDDRGTSPRDGRGSKGPGSRPVSRQGSVTDVRGGAPAPKTSEERFAQAMSSKHGGNMGVQGVMGVMSGVAAPPGSRMSRQPSNRALPGPARQQSFDSRGPQQHRNEGRGSRGARGGPQMGRPGMGRTDTIMDLNLEPVEPLAKSESAWGPGAFKKELAKDADDKEKIEEAMITRKMKGLLNKLTIEKFDAISDQILNIGMTRESIVKGVISQIFEKALDEPNFGAMYAQLCYKLFSELPNVQSWIHREVTDSEFRRALLSRCQEEFERSAKWTASEAALIEQRRAARTRLDTMSDEEKLKIAEEDYERQKLKRRVLGNISFIGELFLKSLISERIMHRNCIAALLKPTENLEEAPEEEDVESLCKLLTTIGPHLDAKGANGPIMDQYFDRIAKLSVHPTLSARIRFMLLDLIDMRKDNWKARTEAAGPKTLVEIRAAAEKAAAAEEAAIQERNRNSHGGRGGGGGGGRGRGDQFRDRRGGGRGSHDNRGSAGSHGGHANSDGWTTQGGSNRNSQAAVLSKPGDMSGFGKNMRTTLGGPVTLGPSGNFGKGGAGGWTVKKKDGPAGAALNRSQSNVGEVTPTANVFSILSHHDTDRKKSVDEGRRPSVSAPMPGSPEKAKPAAAETPAPAAGGKKAFTDEERLKKFEGIVQEWQSLLDTNEVKLSLQDLDVPTHHAEFVTTLLNGTWDKKPDVVKRTRKLIVWLLSENVITAEDVKTALVEQLDMADDIAIDVPTHWKDLGELLSRLLSDAVISLDDVLQASSSMIASRALKNPPALRLLKETLLDIVRHDKEAGLMTIVGSTDLSAFFQDKKRDEPNAVEDWCLEVGLPVALAARRDEPAAAPQ